MYKKILSTLLALCMVLTLMPVALASATNESTYTATVIPGDEGESTYTVTAVPDNEDESTYTATVMPGSVSTTGTVVATGRTLLSISQLKDKYPDGSKWTASFDGSIQCAGFSRLLCYEAYGSEYYTNNADGKWKKHTSSSYIDTGLKAGDLVRYKPGRYGHSVFVVGVSGNDVSIADCNSDLNDTVRWTTVKKSNLKVGFQHAYSAPYPLSGDTPPSVQPEITLSPSSVSMQVGSSATVTVGTKSPGSCYVHAYPSNSNTCGYSWGAWNSTGTAKPLTITGKKVGTASITVVMYDGSTNMELTRKEINVTVKPITIAPPSSSVQQPSVDTINTLNRTGDASLYPTVFKGYLRGTAKYDAYSDSSGTTFIGRIYSGDELKVQSVYSNNGTLWISALCPWDGYASDRLIYTKLDAVIDTSYAPCTALAMSSAVVYTRSNAASKYGSLGKGDAVTIVGQSGQYSQIIYPLAVGGYKIGWCQTNSLARPDISSIRAITSTTLNLTYGIPANATNNLVIMDANQTVLLRSGISGNSVGVNKMIPGVTYYIYIESTLANGTGSVTSAVKKVTLK